MPPVRQRGLIHGQQGSTLIELLVAMPIAILVLGIIVQALGTATSDQQDIERRAQMQTDAQIGLERMTHELRQSTWVRFRSTSVIDMNVRVRATPGSAGIYRLVRYDCSGETCLRREGAQVSYPPPENPTFQSAVAVIGSPKAETGGRRGQIVSHDIFRPTRVNPDTGEATPDFVTPDFVGIRLRMEIEQLRKSRPARRLLLEDGVSLRNRTEYAS
jgi:type II secretory pathway component PulJ